MTFSARSSSTRRLQSGTWRMKPIKVVIASRLAVSPPAAPPPIVRGGTLAASDFDRYEIMNPGLVRIDILMRSVSKGPPLAHASG